jgi:hypothetical protein
MYNIGCPYGMYGGANLYPEFDDVSDPYNVLPPTFGSFPTNNVCCGDYFTTGNGVVKRNISLNSSVHEKSNALPLVISLLAGGLLALGLLHGDKGAKAGKKVIKEIEEAVGAGEETVGKTKKPNIFKRIWGKIFSKKDKTKINVSDDYKDVWDAENAYLKPRVNETEENINAVRKLASASEAKATTQPVLKKDIEEKLEKNETIYNTQAETTRFKPDKDKCPEEYTAKVDKKYGCSPETNCYGLPISSSQVQKQEPKDIDKKPKLISKIAGGVKKLFKTYW